MRGYGHAERTCLFHQPMYHYYTHTYGYYNWLLDKEQEGGDRWKTDYAERYFDPSLDHPRKPPTFVDMRDLPLCLRCVRHRMEGSVYCFVHQLPKKKKAAPSLRGEGYLNYLNKGADERNAPVFVVESEEWRLAHAWRFE